MTVSGGLYLNNMTPEQLEQFKKDVELYKERGFDVEWEEEYIRKFNE